MVKMARMGMFLEMCEEAGCWCWSRGDFMTWRGRTRGAAMKDQLFLPTSCFTYALAVFHFSTLWNPYATYKNLSSNCGFLKMFKSSLWRTADGRKDRSQTSVCMRTTWGTCWRNTCSSTHKNWIVSWRIDHSFPSRHAAGLLFLSWASAEIQNAHYQNAQVSSTSLFMFSELTWAVNSHGWLTLLKTIPYPNVFYVYDKGLKSWIRLQRIMCINEYSV